jgi:hypothetical protein
LGAGPLLPGEILDLRQIADVLVARVSDLAKALAEASRFVLTFTAMQKMFFGGANPDRVFLLGIRRCAYVS